MNDETKIKIIKFLYELEELNHYGLIDDFVYKTLNNYNFAGINSSGDSVDYTFSILFRNQFIKLVEFLNKNNLDMSIFGCGEYKKARIGITNKEEDLPIVNKRDVVNNIFKEYNDKLRSAINGNEDLVQVLIDGTCNIIEKLGDMIING